MYQHLHHACISLIDENASNTMRSPNFGSTLCRRRKWRHSIEPTLSIHCLFVYSAYDPIDFMQWNRSLMVDNTTGLEDCDEWVYDQSEYYSSIMGDVGISSYYHLKLHFFYHIFADAGRSSSYCQLKLYYIFICPIMGDVGIPPRYCQLKLYVNPLVIDN